MKLLNVKERNDLDILFQEYNDAKEKILKDIYQIIIYTESSISRNELFLMSQLEKNILIDIYKEKKETDNKMEK